MGCLNVCFFDPDLSCLKTKSQIFQSHQVALKGNSADTIEDLMLCAAIATRSQSIDE